MDTTSLQQWITLILGIIAGLATILGGIIKVYHYRGQNAPAWMDTLAGILAAIPSWFTNGPTKAVDTLAADVDKVVAKLPAEAQKPAEAVIDKYKSALIAELTKLGI